MATSARRRVVAMRIAAILLVAVGSAWPAGAQDSTPPTPPPVLNDDGLLRKYVWSTLGPEGMVSAALSSGYQQWRGSPGDWPQNKTGYMQRWASEYAVSAITDTTKYAVARAFHQDPSFTRCQCTGAGPRLSHALVAPFTARKRDGHRVPSPAVPAGLFAGAIIPAATWYPERDGIRGGAEHALAGIVAKMAFDVFHEFVPLPHVLQRKKP